MRNVKIWLNGEEYAELKIARKHMTNFQVVMNRLCKLALFQDKDLRVQYAIERD